jgi:hypothetical protein
MLADFSNSLRKATLTIIMAALLTVVGGGSVAFALVGGPDDRHTFHHRVLWIEDPATQAVLSWTTREAGANHVVYYDTAPRGGDVSAYAFKAESFKDGQFTMVEKDAQWVKPAFFHHAHLSNLQPDTEYYVVYSSDAQPSREFHFRTAPAVDKEIALLAGGDSRIGGDEPYDHTDRQKMNMRLRALFEENPDVIAFVHGGDYCQYAEWRYLEPWLNDHELTTTTAGRLLPIIPARGNHDRGVGFVEMFSWPDLQNDYYYVTNLTPEVALVTLNTEISLAGDQRDWLAATLEKERPENRWLLASYHRPAYSSVRGVQDGAMRRNNWVPLFEQFNVDLVYESHDHALKRTLPIRSHAPDLENGITYIGDGGLGVPQRTPDPARWWLQAPGFTKPAHHAHILKFTADKLHVQAIGMEADVLDDFALQPRAVAVGQ